MAFLQKKWVWIFFISAAVAAAGHFYGKLHGDGFIERMYERNDFTLLDDQNDFFTLSKFPEKRYLLLIFTPDGIPTNTVKPFNEFVRGLPALSEKNIDVMLITRTNREIAKNFKRAAQFNGRLLIDTSGTVGKLAGIWGMEPTKSWSYLLTDNKFRSHWVKLSDHVLSVKELEQEWAAQRKK